MENNLVAIDGPAGSGKSAVSRAVAQYLGYGFLGTGNYYRALAFWVREDSDLVSQLDDFFAAVEDDLDPYSNEFRVKTSEGIKNIAAELNTEQITAKVAGIAKNTLVRARLNEHFRKICDVSIYPVVIIEGRDATSVIAPDARVKVFLTASSSVRVERRCKQYPGLDRKVVAQSIEQRDESDNQNTGFLSVSAGVITLDTTDMDFSQSVAGVLDLIERSGLPVVTDEWVENNVEALAAGGDLGATVVIVGRPNVGKSALVNRILGRREAVVENRPGVTRDRVAYPAFWAGRPFTLVDTGGWEPDARGLEAEVVSQAQIGMDIADAIIFVVDSRVGATGTDEAVARMLQRQKKPVYLVANKADDVRNDPDIASFWSLGVGEPYPCSAVHGRGVADLMDRVMANIPKVRPGFHAPAPRVALIGKPNVGKSSLLNRVARSNRAVVDDLAGTTRDPVDALVTIADKPWVFVDTAGLRRKVKFQKGADFYASLRTATVLQRAEVALLLLDATQSVSEQDVRIAEMVVEAGRALVLVINKWDLLDDERRYWLEGEIEQNFARFSWAPRVNISAQTGRGVEKLVPAMRNALASWNLRINTSRLNQFLQQIFSAHPHPVKGGKQPRVLFASQMGIRPPTFVLFTTGFLEAGYRRFIQRMIREEYGFVGTPLLINMKIREKRY